MARIGQTGYAPRHSIAEENLGHPATGSSSTAGTAHVGFLATGSDSTAASALVGFLATASDTTVGVAEDEPPPPIVPAPPSLPQVLTAVPQWDVELAIQSILDHAITIGSSTIGGSDVLGGGLTPVFQNITSKVMQFSIKRGRTANLDTIMQGNAQFTLSDPLGNFNPQGGYHSSVIADQPIMYFHLDEVSGSLQTVDHSGFANTGTYHGAVTWQVVGALADGDPAAKFDGATAYVSVLPISITGVIAVELFFKTTNLGKQYLIEAAPLNTNWGFFIQNGDIYWQGGSTSTIRTYQGVNYADGQYHHAYVQQRGTTVILLVDGVTVATVGSVAAIGNSATAIYVGAAADLSANFFDGVLDEIAVYDHVFI